MSWLCYLLPGLMISAAIVLIIEMHDSQVDAQMPDEQPNDCIPDSELHKI